MKKARLHSSGAALQVETSSSLGSTNADEAMHDTSNSNSRPTTTLNISALEGIDSPPLDSTPPQASTVSHLDISHPNQPPSIYTDDGEFINLK